MNNPLNPNNYRLIKFTIDDKSKKVIEKAIIWCAKRTQPFSNIDFVKEHYMEIDMTDSVIDIDESINAIIINEAGLKKVANIVGVPADILSSVFEERAVSDFVGWPNHAIHPPIICYYFKTSKLTIQYIKQLLS